MGGWGSVTPRAAGVQGAALLYAAQCAKGGWLAKQTPAQRGVCRCARRSARRKRCAGSVTPAHPAEAPGPTWAEPGPGVRYASHPDGRNVPGWVAQAEGSRWPTILRGPAATEHLRSDRARSQAPGPGCPKGAPPQAAAAWRRGLVRATAGARPAAALGGGLDRGRRLRRPARHLCGASEASGTGAAPSRAGGKG